MVKIRRKRINQNPENSVLVITLKVVSVSEIVLAKAMCYHRGRI